MIANPVWRVPADIGQPSYPLLTRCNYCVLLLCPDIFPLTLQTPASIRRSIKLERLARAGQSLSRMQIECEEMLELVLSVCDAEHELTKRAVYVRRQLRRMRREMDRNVSETAIHRIK
jgi:hypothetical protein